MLKQYLSFFLLLLFTQVVQADDGYNIKIKIDGFKEKQVFLGYHLGDKQYIKDTVDINDEGLFVFSGEEELDGGVYLMIMPPDNQYFQVLVNKGEQHFSIHTSAQNPVKDIKIKGSPDNKLFYDYMTFLGEKRPVAENIKKEIEASKDDEKKVETLSKKLDKINEEVNKYQSDTVEKHPKTITAALIKASMEVPIPEFEGDEKEVQLKRYLFYRTHYFDNIDLGDHRMLKTPFLFKRVNYYIEKLTPQHPDSLSLSVEHILEQMKPSEETFKFYLIHFINKYAKSKIVGMDAVYVNIVEKYYATGQAPWTEEEQLAKILKNANTLKPILIGKTAPNINMQKINIEETIKLKDEENEHKRFKSDGPLPLHDLASPYTVLFFWDPDCGHCKKSMPKMLDFYDKYKPKGVEVFAVCTKVYKDLPECASTIKEKEMVKWINVTDPYLLSKYKQIYDIKSTPRIFILDENKKILSKGIGAEQLDEVMDQIIKSEQQ